ncbi:SDR family NAD(P)-dependent oxidoreductase [Dictyobacter arantiisoli]|uniref:PKS/mFAS DH domain-containing protein n=1 Tax=Dictyobacter arantiisoli TaxID=2014874 RepID=A0A5A5TEF3_9CHLR|nr:SDR family NAD(P)-dependent oxidoreductase [Dictyobacter arantiisoli]GCF09615.1 hypothetical protein KDI_31790 [Dictyobacter arantiisoli]
MLHEKHKKDYKEQIVIVGWSTHIPGLASREILLDWIDGKRQGPEQSFGDYYPQPPFEKVRMPSSTIRTIDRCQLMILECAHSLRQQINNFWDASRRQTGVFVGHMGITRNAVLYNNRVYLDDIKRTLYSNPKLSDSALMATLFEQFEQEVKRLVPAANEDSNPGEMPNIIPARVANYFDLKGPNMTLDTGFSSMLSAFEVACRYLQAQELELALVGGINGNSTPEMRYLLHTLTGPTNPMPAEGAFLFALTTQTLAQKADLPILGYVNDCTISAHASTDPSSVLCGSASTNTYNYLGAEGALAIVQALHKGANEKITITCHNAIDMPIVNLTLTVPGTNTSHGETIPLPPRFLQDQEYEPGKTLQIQRYIHEMEELPIEQIRPSMAFLPERCILLTDQPALLEQLTNIPTDMTVLSTRPLATPSRNWFYLPDVTPKAVQQYISQQGTFTHVRVLTDLNLSAPTPACLAALPTALVALHDLTFLVLQQCYEALKEEQSSCIALFLNALPDKTPHPFTGLFGGLIKSIYHELPGCLMYGLFTDTIHMHKGIQQAEQESTARRFLPIIFYQGRSRKTTRLKDAMINLPEQTPARLKSDSVIVAVAGARGITAELLKAVAQYFQPRLYLIGSNPIDLHSAEIFAGSDPEFAKQRSTYIRQQQASKSGKNVSMINKEFQLLLNARIAQSNITAMSDFSGAGKVHYLSCDVTDQDKLTAVMNQIIQAEGHIDLLINAAGLNSSASIEMKNFDEFRKIRDVKMRGYLNLKHALRDCPPRMWCNFGSLLGVMGQPGEADYAAGNSFLSSAATYSHQVLNADEFTIDWTFWKSIGLAANPLTRAYLENFEGYTALTNEEGIHHFIREVNQPAHDPALLLMGAAEKRTIEGYFPGFFSQQNERQKSSSFYLDKVLMVQPDEMVFEHVFDLTKEDYLNHHRVDGHATLPGTFVTEIAAEAAAQLVPDWHVVGFEDAMFGSFLRVPQEKAVAKKIHARVIDRSAEQIIVLVRITTDIMAPNGMMLTKDKLHFQIKVIFSQHFAGPFYWEAWNSAGEQAVPDPYHFPTSPVHLTGMFVATTNTRLHPMGKRATYSLALPADHPVFSHFRVPCILLDGLARSGVLNLIDENYLPLAIPTRIRRIDLYEEVNDCQLSGPDIPIDLYATPRASTTEHFADTNRLVAVRRADGKVIAQIKDIAMAPAGYIHRISGEFILPDQLIQYTSNNMRGGQV